MTKYCLSITKMAELATSRESIPVYPPSPTATVCGRPLFQHNNALVHKVRSIKKSFPGFGVEEPAWSLKTINRLSK